MRSSFVASTVLLASILATAQTALAAPVAGRDYDEASEVAYRGEEDFFALDARAPAKSMPAKKKTQVGLTAGAFKAPSSVYRQAAAQSKNPVFTTAQGKVTASKNKGTVLKGHDADHIVEAQTVAAAVRKAAKKPTFTAIKAVKSILNGPKNMAFLTPKTNRDKGAGARATSQGKTPKPNPAVTSYLKQNKKTSQDTAKAITAAFKKHGSDADVTKENNAFLKAHGVREEILNWLLDELD